MQIKAASLPTGWKWFYYVNPIPKAFTSVAIGQFYCDTSVVGHACPRFTLAPGQEVFTSDYIEKILDSDVTMYGQSNTRAYAYLVHVWMHACMWIDACDRSISIYGNVVVSRALF